MCSTVCTLQYINDGQERDYMTWPRTECLPHPPHAGCPTPKRPFPETSPDTIFRRASPRPRKSRQKVTLGGIVR